MYAMERELRAIHMQSAIVHDEKMGNKMQRKNSQAWSKGIQNRESWLK